MGIKIVGFGVTFFFVFNFALIDKLQAKETGAYIVECGDSISWIAYKIYGNAKHWPELAELNELDAKAPLSPGQHLLYQIDDRSRGFHIIYRSQKRSRAVAKSGEGLADLSFRIFGDRSCWRFIWALNKNSLIDPDDLKAGQVLYYPDQTAFRKAINKYRSLYRKD